MEGLKIVELRKDKDDKNIDVSQVQCIYPERCERELRLMYQILYRLDFAPVDLLYCTRIAAETKMFDWGT